MTDPEWVIDVDAHVTEPGDVWTSRLPARLRDRGPRLLRDAKTGRDTWHLGDSTPLVPVGHTAVAGWSEPFPAAPRNMDEIPLAAWQPGAPSSTWTRSASGPRPSIPTLRVSGTSSSSVSTTPS